MAHAGEIRLAGLTKQFGGLKAVDGIDLTIDGGSYCCLLGPSGCGKTTILRMIAGHESPTDGSILIGDMPVVGLSPVQRGTAMMFQSYALFPHLSVVDNVAFRLKMRGIRKAERRRQAHEVLEKVQMEMLAERMPAQLSGGQQQRVALARAVITNPSVLLLDEPLSALDEFLRLQMRGELRRMQRDLGITFVHVTHTQLEAIAVADNVVVMNDGRIEQAASAREVYAYPGSAYVARFMGGQNVLHGVVIEAGGGGRAKLNGDHGEVFELDLRDVSVQQGDTVFFAIRRDLIRLQDGGATAGGATAGAANAIAATVYAIEYQGTYVKVTLQTKADDEFVVHVPDGEFFANPSATGDAVAATWQTEDVHLLRADLGRATGTVRAGPYDEERVGP